MDEDQETVVEADEVPEISTEPVQSFDADEAAADEDHPQHHLTVAEEDAPAEEESDEDSEREADKDAVAEALADVEPSEATVPAAEPEVAPEAPEGA